MKKFSSKSMYLNNTKIYKDLTLPSTIHKSSRLVGSQLVIQKKSMQSKLISRELYTAAMQEIIHSNYKDCKNLPKPLLQAPIAAGYQDYLTKF